MPVGVWGKIVALQKRTAYSKEKNNGPGSSTQDNLLFLWKGCYVGQLSLKGNPLYGKFESRMHRNIRKEIRWVKPVMSCMAHTVHVSTRQYMYLGCGAGTSIPLVLTFQQP